MEIVGRMREGGGEMSVTVGMACGALILWSMMELSTRREEGEGRRRAREEAATMEAS